MADDRLEIEILLDDGSIKQGFAKVDREGKRSAESLKSSFQGVGTAIAAIGAAFAGAFAVRKVVEAAQVQEDAVNSLNASLAAAGRFSKESSQDFQNFAAEIQKVTTIGDEAVLSQLALASNFARTNDEAKALTKAAIDLAAATGRNAEEALKQLGKTLSGTAGELAESVPAVRNLTKAQLEAGDAISLVGERFAGVASAQTNTFSGRILQLGNVFGDLLEEVGAFITKSPALTNLFGLIVDGLTSAIQSLSGFRQQSGDIFVPLLNGLAAFATAINFALVGPLEFVVNLVKFTVDGIARDFQGLVFAVTSSALKLVEIFSPTSGLANSIRGFNEVIGIQFREFSANASESFQKLFGFEQTEQINAFVENLVAKVNEANESGFIPLQNNVTATTDKIVKEAKKAEFNVGQALGTGIAKSVQDTVRALQSGENAFSAFAKSILSVFGDLAIQLGSFFIIQGIAVEALKAISGAAAVAAGIALVALGTLLKGASGGAGGLTTPGGVPAGDAGLIGGGGLVDDIDETEAGDQRETRVDINIEGNVFDSAETGLRIVDIINNSFDASGSRLVTA